MRAGGVFGKDSVSILQARRSRVSVWDALGMLAMGRSAQGIQALHLTEALQGGAYCVFAERIARVGRLTKSARVTQGNYARVVGARDVAGPLVARGMSAEAHSRGAGCPVCASPGTLYA